MNYLSNAIKTIQPRDDDTLFDRVNYYYSTIIIIIAALTLTAKQYVGEPLQCFVPAEFTKAWEQYAENYCFVHNTYWVQEDIPESLAEREAKQLIYYQWVPFLMALEAAFFYVPVIFWSQMNTKSGLNISTIVKIVQKVDSTENTEREKAVDTICRYIEDSVKLQKVRREGSSYTEKYLTIGLLNGSYLANVYILTKLLYLFNVIGQFVLMNQFLGQNNYFWGAHILNDIRKGRDWELSGNFPRITMCDFTVRLMGNIQRYSIQCVLVLNMFNEKVFLFLYLWFIMVFFMTFADMLRWVYMTKLSTSRRAFITRYVKVEKEDSFLFHEYCDKIINADGVIVLKMIGGHSNELFAQEILMSLWKKFKESVTLNHVIVSHPMGGFYENGTKEQRPMNLLQRTLSVMGAHVQIPVNEYSNQMGIRHRDLSAASTPQFNFEDAVTEPIGVETPLLLRP